MTHECRPDHERWLIEALTSSIDALSPEARHGLEQCRECAPLLAELGDVRAALGHAAESERAALAAAEREGGAVEEALVRRTLAAHLEGRPRRLRRVVPWLLIGSLAAAGLSFLITRMLATDRASPEVLLGGQRIEIEAPAGRADFGRFTWQDATPDGGGYRVRGWSADGKSLFDRTVDAPPLFFEPEETANWSDRILWTVEALDRARNAVPGASDSAEAWR